MMRTLRHSALPALAALLLPVLILPTTAQAVPENGAAAGSNTTVAAPRASARNDARNPADNDADARLRREAERISTHLLARNEGIAASLQHLPPNLSANLSANQPAQAASPLPLPPPPAPGAVPALPAARRQP